MQRIESEATCQRIFPLKPLKVMIIRGGASSGVGKALQPRSTRDGDLPCSYEKKLTGEDAAVEKAAEGEDVWEGEARDTTVADGRGLTMLKAKRGVSELVLGPQPLGYEGAGEED